MNPKRLLLAMLLLSLFASSAAVQASGAPVNEDYAPLIALTDAMIADAKQNNTETALIKMDEGMKIATELSLKNNSLTLSRFCPKLRAAKKALKAGKIPESIAAMEGGKTLLTAEKSGPSWDGGSSN
jgi:hypothetical protein